MKGLDLSKLKKVSSDDKVTVFKHANGHELKVAHAGLSPKLLKELQALPMQGEKPKKMADGGDPSIPVPAQYTPGVSDPGPQADTGENPNNPSPDDQAPLEVEPVGDDSADSGPSPASAPGSTSDDSSEDIPAPSDQDQPLDPQQVYTDHMQETGNELSSFANDLLAGKITPETYSDLFAKKSTLGKIGMIFGAMVGSAGAGLSHQHNLLLGMMNQEINNDLAAQEKSNDNSKNWLKLAQAQKITEAQQQLYSAQTQTQKTASALNLANSKLVGTDNAKSMMQYAFLHHAAQLANAIPPGPQKAAAQQTLQTVGSAVQQDVQNRAHKTATLLSQQAAQLQPPGANLVNIQGINDLQAREGAGDPTISSGETGEATKELGDVEQTETSRKNFMDSFDALNTALAGHLSPNERAARIAQMKQDIMQGNRNMGVDAAEKAANAMIPSGSDMPGSNTRAIKMQLANKFFNEGESNTPELDRRGLRKYPAQNAAAQPQHVSKSGRPISWDGKKWVYR